MKIIEIDPPFDIGKNPDADEQDSRSPGLHVSNIIYSVQKSYLKLNELPESDLRVRREMGFMWERVASGALSKMHIKHPGEISKNGIYMSPDCIDIKSHAVEDWKCTWKSSRRDIEEDFWSWWCQAKAYAYGLGYNKARLNTLFINGNYRGSGPEAKSWEATFSKQELRDNWNMLLEHAKEKGLK